MSELLRERGAMPRRDGRRPARRPRPGTRRGRPRRRDRAPRPQAVQHPGDRLRPSGPRRLRGGPVRHHRAADRDRSDHRFGRLPQPRAGARAASHARLGHLRARHRRAPVPERRARPSAGRPRPRPCSPASTTTRRSSDADVPAPMRSLVGRMMSPSPADRPTAAEVARRSRRWTSCDHGAARDACRRPTRVAVGPAPVWSPSPRRPCCCSRSAACWSSFAATTPTPPAGAAELVVPSVRGEQVAQATEDLEAAGFRVVRRLVDGPTPRGLVLRQSPAPGIYAGEDPATVVLRVSSGLGGPRQRRPPRHDRTPRPRGPSSSSAFARRGSSARPSTGVGTVVAVDREGRVRVGSRSP